MSWPTFPIPKSSLVADVIVSSDGGKPLTQDDIILKTVNGHPLNQFLQLVVPVKVESARGRVKDAIDDVKMKLSTRLPLLSMILNGSLPPTANESLSFFKLSRIPLHLLYHKIFIESYIRKGIVYCISIDCDIITEDCLAIIPSGQLILSLTTKSYQRLGIEGKTSALKKKNPVGKKIVEIDLKSDLSGKFESKYYKRMFRCMRNSGLVFDVLIRWQPNSTLGPDISCESIGNYFDFMKCNPEKTTEVIDGGSLKEKEALKMTITPCLPKLRSFTNARQVIPATVIEFTNEMQKLSAGDAPNQSEHDMELFVDDSLEFIGASLCSVKTNSDSEKYHLSTFGFDPKLNKYEASQVMCSEVSGLIPVEFIHDLLSEIQENGLPEEVPFITLVVNGFENSLVSYHGKRNEKGKDLSGENIYGLLITSCTESNTDDAETDNSGERKGKRMRIERVSERKPNKCLLWRLSDSFDYSIEKL